jgi:FtsZ-binding cell division protein ZapB
VFDDNNTAPTAYLEKGNAGLFSNGTWTSYYAQFEAANRNQTNGNVEYFSFSGHPVGGFSSAVIGAVNEDHANYYGDLFFWTRGSSGYGVRVFINQNGLVGIGTTSPTHLIHLSGGAYSDGATWYNASSVRWKDNIEPLTGGVETLRQLHPVAYNYKKTPAKRTMGFIAEEVGKVLPTIVDWDKAEAGYAESYDHVAILALTVQALKEQQKQISEHQSTIQQLREHNEKLQERIAILERTVKQCAAS